jgi:V/A-type H+-transporting ATPase subunit A
VDGATSAERQRHVFAYLTKVLAATTDFPDKDAARTFYQTLTQLTKDWNRAEMSGDEFLAIEARLDDLLAEAAADA